MKKRQVGVITVHKNVNYGANLQAFASCNYLNKEGFDCKVIDDNTGEELGIITDVSETGANDVWHIKTPKGEVLIPAIKQVVVSVDVEEGIVKINPIKGLFDDVD